MIHATADRDGWHAVMAVLPSIRDAEADGIGIVFQVVDPEGFSFRSARTLATDRSFDEDVVADECRRFIDRIVDGGPSTDGVFGRVGPFPSVRNRDGWISGGDSNLLVAHLRPDEEKELEPVLRDAIFEERIGSMFAAEPWGRWMHPRRMTAVDPTWAPVFVLPETRTIAKEVAVRRPWMLPMLLRPSFALHFVDARSEDMPSGMTAAGIAAAGSRWQEEDPRRAGAWSERAVACLDRFLEGVDPRIRPGTEIQFVHAVSVLPPSWIPRTLREFEDLYRLSPLVRQDFVEDGRHFAELLAPSKGRFGELLEALVPDPWDDQSLRDLWGRIHDTCVHVHLRLVMPVLERAGAYDERIADVVSHRLLTQGGGILLMKEKSEVWHARFRGLPDLACGRGDASWPLLSEPFVHECVEMRFLGSADALDEEGTAMDHCVASYVDVCASGRSHVASVRAIDGGRISTAEFSLDDDGRPTVVQHHAVGNAPAPVEAVAAVDAWLAAVASGTVAIDPEACELRPSPSNAFEVPAVGTPRDWKGILQDRLARMGWEELASEILVLADRAKADAEARPGWT